MSLTLTDNVNFDGIAILHVFASFSCLSACIYIGRWSWVDTSSTVTLGTLPWSFSKPSRVIVLKANSRRHLSNLIFKFDLCKLIIDPSISYKLARLKFPYDDAGFLTMWLAAKRSVFTHEIYLEGKHRTVLSLIRYHLYTGTWSSISKETRWGKHYLLSNMLLFK